MYGMFNYTIYTSRWSIYCISMSKYGNTNNGNANMDVNTCLWILRVHVGKYSRHGAYGHRFQEKG